MIRRPSKRNRRSRSLRGRLKRAFSLVHVGDVWGRYFVNTCSTIADIIHGFLAVSRGFFI